MTRHPILIVGAGYGGISTARELDKHHVPFTIVNKHTYHYFKTLLHEAAGGRNDVQTYAIELTDVLRKPTSQIVKDTVHRIDWREQVVYGDHGEYPYARLVIALGSQTSDFSIPGIKEHAYFLNSLASARDLRERIDSQLASLPEQAPSAPLDIVIGGGGLTGVELIGELADYVPHFLRRHHLDPHWVRLSLIHAHDDLLPDVDPRLRAVAKEKLVHRGVNLILGRRVIAAAQGEVTLSDGSKVKADTFVWTGGIEAPPLLRESGFTVDDRGRVPVDAYLQVKGVPNVFAVGDCARFETQDGAVLAPTGQVAEQMGTHLAHNLLRLLDNDTMEPFVYHDHGMVASLGPTYGVAEIGRHHATGLMALFLKDGSKMKYLMHLGGPHVLLEKRKQWIEI
ncbi:NAD(P)/FAD-dependent oxidoreductase [Alicyclobacillus acidiphilus]|uniref:NAD(P)/FAD-dependent oxidoreductase n=1 Tax=Alicyclobacillus acidiphilus TaxID=182455 RepID=UPI000A842F80|nr:NAD(P)/FAD-dependent oxidoreductase [Alicyclobacillus acidiphilus]